MDSDVFHGTILGTPTVVVCAVSPPLDSDSRIEIWHLAFNMKNGRISELAARWRRWWALAEEQLSLRQLTLCRLRACGTRYTMPTGVA
jgi:hypothetical protein